MGFLLFPVLLPVPALNDIAACCLILFLRMRGVFRRLFNFIFLLIFVMTLIIINYSQCTVPFTRETGDKDKEIEYQLKTTKAKLEALGIVTENLKVNNPAASNGVVDPRGSRQMCMQACPLGSLLAGIKE